MTDKFYVYRFLDKDDNTIYIGRTNNLERRLNTEHFTKHGHLPQQCYRECSAVEFMELSSESEMKIFELYMINKYSPFYNTVENKNDNFNFSLKEDWTKFKINDIMFKKEYKIYNYLIMNPQKHYRLPTMSRDLKLTNITIYNILQSLEKKGYISIKEIGSNFIINHSLKELKLP